MALRDLHEGRADGARGKWQTNLGQDLVGCERRGEVRPEEVRRGDRSTSAGAHGIDLAVEREQQRRPFGGGIRVRDAPTGRSAIADRGVSDQADRLGDHRASLAEPGQLLDRAMARRRAEHQRVPIDPRVVELGDAVQVDQRRRGGQPERHHRHQTLAPGDHLRVLTALGEQRDRLLDASRREVLERSRLHARELSPWAPAGPRRTPEGAPRTPPPPGRPRPRAGG